MWIAKWKKELGGNPSLDPDVRSDHEKALEQSINMHGEQKGIDFFRLGCKKKNGRAETVIRSYRRARERRHILKPL
jgi:hypothetical protein